MSQNDRIWKNQSPKVFGGKEKRMEEKKDRRTARTKKAIHVALASLMAERRIDDITISEIAKRADINRKTFYNYYSGIHMLLGEIEEGILADFATALAPIKFEKPRQLTREAFERLHSVLSKNLNFYRFLLLSDKNSYFSARISASLCAMIKEMLQNRVDMEDAKAELIIQYTLSGIFAGYRYWFSSNKRPASEDLFGLIQQLCFNGVDSFLPD